MGYKDDIVDQYPYLTYANEPSATIEDVSGGGGGGGGDSETVNITIVYQVAPETLPTAAIIDENDEETSIKLATVDGKTFGGSFPIGALFTVYYVATGLEDGSISFYTVNSDTQEPGWSLPLTRDQDVPSIFSIVPKYESAIEINNRQI